MYGQSFDPYKTPVLSWRWRVIKGIKDRDPQTKSGDDYPIRVYVIFQYDEKSAGFLVSVKYSALKAIYGEYPPHSSLNYVWLPEAEQDWYSSPYTNRSQMVVIRKEPSTPSIWKNESTNILDDYRRIFKDEPPKSATIAVMGDSDNSGQSTEAELEFIEVSRSVGDRGSENK